MKSYKSLLLSILSILICGNLFAADQQFGFVNVADALLLHPTMRYFDPVNKRFKLDALKISSPETRIEENKAQNRAKLEKLQQELKEIEAEKEEESDNYHNQLQALTASFGNLKDLPENKKAQYNSKKEAINKAFFEKSNTIRKKILIAKKRIEECENESYYTGLTTQGETSRIFSLMLDDVYDVMTIVADHYKVSFVFNSSAEINYIDGKWSTTNPLPAFFDDYEQTVQERDGKKITGAAFTSWLTERNSAFLNCNDRRLSAFVMKGGLNMTPAVIDGIYQKHKISKEHREFIQEYFSKYINNDNSDN